MLNILFINPVVREKGLPMHVPYGLGIIVAIAETLGHRFQVLDLNALRPPDQAIVEALRADRWDIVALGGITTTYGSVKRALQLLDGALDYRPAVILGGGIITAMPHDIMSLLPRVDLGVIGEGLQTFPEILERLESKRDDWQNVLGVAWRRSDGKVIVNRERPLVPMPEIDQTPYPAWDYFPLDVYFSNSSQLFSEEAYFTRRRLDVNASYGCALICRFCYHLGLTGELQTVETEEGNHEVVFGYRRDVRWHSPRYVVDMVKHMKNKYQVDFVCFLDENMMTMHRSTKGQWLTEICQLWIQEGLQPQCVRDKVPHDLDKCDGVHWGGTSHASQVDEKILPLMHDAGCSWLCYGLESFNDRILKQLGKGALRKHNIQCIEKTVKAGIRPTPNQIIGFPCEFFDSIRDSMTAWEELGLMVKPFFATPFPGSEWYYKYRQLILEQYDGSLEAFLLDLGDCTEVTANISLNFNKCELYGLREMMLNNDKRGIDEYEKMWHQHHDQPVLDPEKIPWFAKYKTGEEDKYREEIKAYSEGRLIEVVKGPRPTA